MKRKYRMTVEETPGGKIFFVEVRGRFVWHVIKCFKSDDAEYAYNCAVELLEMLREDIE